MNKQKVPKLRFPEFTGEWEEKKINFNYNVEMCKRIYKNETLIKGEIPFYKIGTFGRKANAFISISLFNEYQKKYKYPKIGDILISCSGTVGKCVLFDGHPSYYQDSNIVWLRERKNLIVKNFLFYILKNLTWKELPSTTIKRIYTKDLLNKSINFPSLPEQEKIADFLTLFDKEIELEEKKLDLLKENKKGYMQKIFNRDLRFKDEFGNDYPQWEEKKLKNFLKISEKVKATKIDRNKLLTVKLNLKGVCKNTNNKTLKIGSTVYFHRNSGDFIFGKQNFFNGAFGIVPNYLNGYLSSGDIPTLSFISKDLISAFFMFFISRKSYYKKLELYSSGTGSKRIHEDTFLNLYIDVPSLPEQEKIANFLSTIDEEIELMENKIEKLKGVKKGLLQQMFI